MKQSKCEHRALAFRVVFIEAMWARGSGENGGVMERLYICTDFKSCDVIL